jgi:hypothetical protein
MNESASGLEKGDSGPETRRDEGRVLSDPLDMVDALPLGDDCCRVGEPAGGE